MEKVIVIHLTYAFHDIIWIKEGRKKANYCVCQHCATS